MKQEYVDYEIRRAIEWIGIEDQRGTKGDRQVGLGCQKFFAGYISKVKSIFPSHIVWLHHSPGIGDGGAHILLPMDEDLF